MQGALDLGGHGRDDGRVELGAGVGAQLGEPLLKAEASRWDASRKFSVAEGRARRADLVQLRLVRREQVGGQEIPPVLVDGVYIDPRARH